MEELSRFEMRRVRPLLWNTWVDTIPRKRIHASKEELFSVRSLPRDYKKDKEYRLIQLFRVEAGSNTSTVALRVVGGDEKGIQCLGI
jgi:hypothetical protein